MNKQRRMLTFLLLWFGQLVSLLGTKMTRFALLIWVFQETGQATAMALLGFFSFGAVVVMSPLAGYWVDRLDRRRVMLFADLGAGLMTLIVLLFITQGTLQLWHLYVTQMFIGFFDAFHTPAYAAATSVLLPKRHYARANGLRSLAIATADIAAPMFAGVLFAFIGVQGVMLIDVLTLLIAAATLLFIRIPVPQAQPHADAQPDENFRQQLSFGLRYIAQRKGLMGLLAVMMIINLFAALTYYGIFPAMILARTDGDETALGIVAAALGIGGVIGSILMSTWGGPKRRIHGVLAYTGLSFLSGDFLFGIGQSLPVWIISGISAAAFIPLITGSNLAIWQVKVPPAYQGRVFAAQHAARQAMLPLGFILGGTLADFVFEPAMMPGAPLANVFGWLVGTGPGAGMALMFICTGIGGTLTGFGGYLFPALRNVERDLPDFDDPAMMQVAPAMGD